MSEEDDADGTSGSLKGTYVGRNTGQAEGDNPSSGSWIYYTNDLLGSTRRVWKDDRSLAVEVEYSPFGEIDFVAGSESDVTHTYTGLEYDGVAGLYFTLYRYYDPGTSRWMTRDPLGMVDGPNVYAYVGANPVGRVDREGLLTDSVTQTATKPGASGSVAREAIRDYFTLPAGAMVGLGSCKTSESGDCTKDRYDTLRAKVKDACKEEGFSYGCTGDDTYADLQRKLTKSIRCLRARNRINTECFGGGDKGHKQQVTQVQNTIKNCMKLMGLLN